MIYRYILIITVIMLLACQSSDKPFIPPKNDILTFVHQYDYVDYSQQDLPEPYGIVFYASLYQDVSFPVSKDKKIKNLGELLNAFDDVPLLIMLRLTNHQLKDINQGKVNAELDSLARLLKSYKHDIYLGVGFEVNNPRYMLVSSLYTKAHRYLVERFRQNHVNNVSYVWHVIGMEPRWEEPITLESCYPGDDYVNWVGLSMHNILPHHYPEDTFFKKSTYDNVSAFAAEHDLPIMMCETSTRSVKNNFNYRGDSLWGDWYEPFLDFVKNNDVRAICHIFYSFDDDVVLNRWRKEMQKQQYIHARSEPFKLLSEER